MAEAVASGDRLMELEIRGGPWEGIHAVIFYTSVTLALLASLGIMSLALGIGCVVLLFYSMFAIFSSPTYVVVDPEARRVTLEHYHYFIPSRRVFDRDALEGLEVIESQHVPASEGEGDSRRDLSYFVRVYLRFNNKGRLKIFRSGMTGMPSENRRKAYLIVENIAGSLDIPVSYMRRGAEDGGEEA